MFQQLCYGSIAKKNPTSEKTLKRQVELKFSGNIACSWGKNKYNMQEETDW